MVRSFSTLPVLSRGWFKQQDPALFFRYRTVLHAARHHDELAVLDPFMAVTKLHTEAAFHHQEHFVLIFMMMKDEFAFELVELDILAIELGGDVGLPKFGDPGKFFGNVNFRHV